ncbi:heme-binding protein [Amycolatopsis sp. NPDC004368]
MTAHVFRAGAPADPATLHFLRELTGRWMGRGFNLIARPDQHDKKPFFLELNSTQETLEFEPIGAPVPNRGSAQDDIFFRGLHYKQQISDGVTGGALHFETGQWIDVPATTSPAAPETVVRMATIPHGDALLAQGQPLKVKGGPRIDVADSTPITKSTGKPDTNAQYLAPFTTTPLPPGFLLARLPTRTWCSPRRSRTRRSPRPPCCHCPQRT